MAVFSAAMSFTPGPNTTLATAIGVNHSVRRALRFCVAVAVGCGLLLLACWVGVGGLVTRVPAVGWGLRVVGAAYLGWLAYRLWHATRISPDGSGPAEVGFLSGVGLQLVNGKAWLFALTLTAGWVTGSGAEPAGVRLVATPSTFRFGRRRARRR